MTRANRIRSAISLAVLFAIAFPPLAAGFTLTGVILTSTAQFLLQPSVAPLLMSVAMSPALKRGVWQADTRMIVDGHPHMPARDR